MFRKVTNYRIVGYFKGGNFSEFHELSLIRENFTLKMFLFSGFSTQSVTIHENFALEKLGRLSSRKFFPPENTRYTVFNQDTKYLEF